MALLVDGSWCEVDELQFYDGSATTVASEEGIDLARKMSLSEEWITDQVDEFVRWETGTAALGAMPGGGLTATNAVVDERLKRWHAAHVLAALYRDACYSQVNDRFEKKWKGYEADAAARREEYLRAGVAYVGNPVRRPGAPAVSVVVGTQPAGAYSVSVTRVDAGGRESAPSPVTAVQAAGGNGLSVTASGLSAGERWNVYVTSGDAPRSRQNNTPLGRAETWTMPSSGLVNGVAEGAGQTPDGYVKRRRILPRG